MFAELESDVQAGADELSDVVFGRLFELLLRNKVVCLKHTHLMWRASHDAIILRRWELRYGRHDYEQLIGCITDPCSRDGELRRARMQTSNEYHSAECTCGLTRNERKKQ